MATNTPYLNLSLLGLGESPGTWGIPLNANFQKVDTLAGEVIAARGSAPNVNDRISGIENEVAVARGTFGNLNDRLSVLLLPNGTLNVGNFPKATAAALGIVRLSTTAANPADPIVVGDNDTRLLTLSQKNALVSGGVTTLHKHNLSEIADVTATAAQVNELVAGSVTLLHEHNLAQIADVTVPVALLNQSLTSISANVTSANLNTLTGGGVVPKSLMTIPNATLNYTGIVSLSVTPVSLAQPIAIGDNDTRILNQTQKNELTSAAVTSLHKHNLIDGAADVLTTASELNQLSGITGNVSASNLNILTGGTDTALHNHDTRYYTKTQSDSAITATQAAATGAIAAHNNDNASHAGDNLSLGDITVVSINSASAGISQTIRSHATDATGAVKWEIKDKSGVSKIYGTESGELHVDKLVARVHEVVETTTLTQDVIATEDLTVNGNTVLGNNTGVDTLAVNAQAQFNASINVTGGVTATGAITGSNITTLTTGQSALQTEVTNARNGETNLQTRLATISGSVTTVSNSLATFTARNDNPHDVTITQAIAADGGTNITVAQLETLSDGSSADALHTHAKYDNELTASRNSATYGAFASLDLRLEASETILSSVKTEVENAREGYISVDARLDAINATITSNNSTISGRMTTAEADIDTLQANAITLQTEVTNARNAFGSLDARLDAMDTLIGSNNSSITGRMTIAEGDIVALEGITSTLTSEKATKYEYTGASSTNHVVTHNLGNQFPSVTIWDTGTNTVILTGITSITANTANQLTVVLGSAKAVKVVVQG